MYNPYPNLSDDDKKNKISKRGKRIANLSNNDKRKRFRKRIKTLDTVVKMYPKRSIRICNYAEVEDYSEDEHTYCDICEKSYLTSCSLHPLRYITDTEVPLNRYEDRPQRTLPKSWLTIRKSAIKNAGKGVFSKKRVPKGVKFGPYDGEMITDFGKSQYCWEIKKHGRVIMGVDASNTKIANWMRYVNCARYLEEQSLMAYQYKSQIYYRTVQSVKPKRELLVYYGPHFAKALGIDIKNINRAKKKYSVKVSQTPSGTKNTNTQIRSTDKITKCFVDMGFKFTYVHKKRCLLDQVKCVRSPNPMDKGTNIKYNSNKIYIIDKAKKSTRLQIKKLKKDAAKDSGKIDKFTSCIVDLGIRVRYDRNKRYIGKTNDNNHETAIKSQIFKIKRSARIEIRKQKMKNTPRLLMYNWRYD